MDIVVLFEIAVNKQTNAILNLSVSLIQFVKLLIII